MTLNPDPLIIHKRKDRLAAAIPEIQTPLPDTDVMNLYQRLDTIPIILRMRTKCSVDKCLHFVALA